jgi:hypothetical protein
VPQSQRWHTGCSPQATLGRGARRKSTRHRRWRGPRRDDQSLPQKILLVDFDVEQSFGQLAGQSGMWVMRPVVTGGEIESEIAG